MIDELDDRWILPLRGAKVARAARETDGGLVLGLDSGGRIAVGPAGSLSRGPLRAPGVTVRPVADLTETEVAALAGATVLSAVAFKAGSLRIVLDSGMHLGIKAVGGHRPVAVDVPGSGSFVHDGSSWAVTASAEGRAAQS